jgi:hypothetical protein
MRGGYSFVEDYQGYAPYNARTVWSQQEEQVAMQTWHLPLAFRRSGLAYVSALCRLHGVGRCRS